MTLDEFVAFYDNKQVEFDGLYLYQCVDLVEQYMQDVLGLTVVTGIGNAHDYYDNFPTIPFLYDNFERIPYMGVNLPQKGDIMVWSDAVGGGAGHISIAYKDITSSSFVCFGQNWTMHERSSLEPHSNYNNVLGWLRSKSTPPIPPISGEEKKKGWKWQIWHRCKYL